MKIKLGKKEAIFFVGFTVLVFIAQSINFSALTGTKNQFFTLFQFFGPIAGGILGSTFGVLTVLFAQTAQFIAAGKEITMLNVLRLLPMLFAAGYFSSKGKKVTASIMVPLVCIAIFLAHPIGRQAWYFSLFWTVPLIAKLMPQRLFLRSLGATFTAHAVGGAIWAWTVPMTVQQWNLLIPVVIIERLLFATGISVSYVAINSALDKLKAIVPSGFVNVDTNYIFSRKFLKAITSRI
ncbi:hypothetical protein HYY73_01410 [Candidatus Woesearchaeota archaeon]|nr:hypothetical protein [Candidatus Woesearchaeota archaeon]